MLMLRYLLTYTFDYDPLTSIVDYLGQGHMGHLLPDLGLFDFQGQGHPLLYVYLSNLSENIYKGIHKIRLRFDCTVGFKGGF